MSGLWILWVGYVLALAGDYFYIQPLSRKRALQNNTQFIPGIMSYGLRAALPLFTVLLITRTFLFDVYHIPTPSMEPNLNQGSRIWVNRVAYGLRSPLSGLTVLGESKPQAGDVIVFKYPREPRTVFVKRLLGTPGDKIRVDGDQIWINGRLLNEKQHFSTGSANIADTFPVILGQTTYVLKDDPLITAKLSEEWVVPAEHYFVIGDNINHSEDSRFWGFVSERHLVGRVL